MPASLKSYFDGLARWQRRPVAAAEPAGPKKINLALQGGGAHGAFTWGVADHLLRDERIEIAGLSGASAGAVNAVMIADGLARGGRAEARKRLAEFWRAASTGGRLPPLQRAVTDRLFALMPFSDSPVRDWFSAMARHFSPYEFNPLAINPLRELIERFVDFDAVRAAPMPLYISTTNVHTGRMRIFPREQITPDVVMASAALPFLFQAVEIDGVPYWDGGYMSNPPLMPFLRSGEADDIILVQINPVQRQTTPKTSGEIVNRLNEITFNSALIAEMRTLDFVQRLIDQGRLPEGSGDDQYRRLHLHRIDLGQLGTRLNASSKLTTDYQFFDLLRRSGQRAAKRFLDGNFAALGERSTVDAAAESAVEWA